MKSIFLVLLLSISLLSCNKVKEKAKETINKGGETVGKTATEFIEGVTEGIDKSLSCEISLSENLISKGLKTGKFSIENDTLEGNNNTLIMYFIFDKNFKETISIKVFDKKNLEEGRTNIVIEGKSGEAKYFDVKFDKRTNIEVKSKITIE